MELWQHEMGRERNDRLLSCLRYTSISFTISTRMRHKSRRSGPIYRTLLRCTSWRFHSSLSFFLSSISFSLPCFTLFLPSLCLFLSLFSFYICIHFRFGFGLGLCLGPLFLSLHTSTPAH